MTDTPWVLRLVDLTGQSVNGGPLPGTPGNYLESYDPEYAGGQGLARWTDDPAKAMRFDDGGAAMRCWQAIPQSRPVRDDGKPNRPLTAYSVTFEPAPQIADPA